MRKIIAIEWLSIDGFVAGPANETEWFTWDEEIEKHYKTMQQGLDTILFGRNTYEMMASYWPTPLSKSEDPAITKHMNESRKIVFSKTLQEVIWNNSSIQAELAPDFITELKNAPGKDIVIYGSTSILSQLTAMNLVDEFRFMISPVVLGAGKSLLSTKSGVKLNLVDVRHFHGGGVLLTYQLFI